MTQEDYRNIDVAALSDPELITATSLWRTRAAHGGTDAQRICRLHEDEMARRFGGATTMPASFMTDMQGAGKPWWKRW